MVLGHMGPGAATGVFYVLVVHTHTCSEQPLQRLAMDSGCQQYSPGTSIGAHLEVALPN